LKRIAKQNHRYSIQQRQRQKQKAERELNTAYMSKNDKSIYKNRLIKLTMLSKTNNQLLLGK